MKYDKKRITSTVILGIFLLSALFAVIVFLPLSWTALKGSAEEGSKEEAAAVIFGSLIIVLAMLAYIISGVLSAICLPFAIANRKSTLKAVRIISYVYDGLFGALIITSIVKLVLYMLGI